jgi:hypothetical protein
MVLVPHQVHGSEVREVGPDTVAEDLVCDALLTRAPGIAIGVAVADCIPLYAINAGDRVIGVAHCGWRGLACGMVENFVGEMNSRSRRASATLYLAGPSIGPCCYEVGDDLVSAFPEGEALRCSASREGRTYFDLRAVLSGRLRACGVAPGLISIDNTCTSCKKSILSSFRASGTGCGRMLAFAMLTE